MNIFVDSDRTTITLRALLYYLIIAPKCLAKLSEELEEG